MATNDKESNQTTAEDTFASHKTNHVRPTHRPVSGALVGGAVGVGALLLLGGAVFGFMISRIGDRDDMMGRSLMRTGLQSKQGIAIGEPAGGMRGHMFGGTYGKVTNVSDSSITLTDERSGGSVTFKIDSNTDINDSKGDNAKVSDIKVGDTVSVRATSATDDTTADTITINPTRY